MSIEALIFYLFLEVIILTVFYIAGRMLKKKWKFLIIPNVVLLIFGAVIALMSFSIKPDCTNVIEESYCGLGAVAYFVIGAGMVGLSLLMSLTGLPVAYLGSKRKNLKNK